MDYFKFEHVSLLVLVLGGPVLHGDLFDGKERAGNFAFAFRCPVMFVQPMVRP